MEITVYEIFMFAILQGLLIFTNSFAVLSMANDDIVKYFSIVSFALSMVSTLLIATSYGMVVRRNERMVPKYLRVTVQLSAFSLLGAFAYHVMINYINGIFSFVGYSILFMYIYKMLVVFTKECEPYWLR